MDKVNYWISKTQTKQDLSDKPLTLKSYLGRATSPTYRLWLIVMWNNMTRATDAPFMWWEEHPPFVLHCFIVGHERENQGLAAQRCFVLRLIRLWDSADGALHYRRWTDGYWPLTLTSFRWPPLVGWGAHPAPLGYQFPKLTLDWWGWNQSWSIL